MAGVTGVAAPRPELSLPGLSGAAEAAGQAAARASASLPGSIRLRIFQPTGRVYAEVLDPTTREVVKTIPPMEMLRVMASVHEALGLLLDREG